MARYFYGNNTTNILTNEGPFIFYEVGGWWGLEGGGGGVTKNGLQGGPSKKIREEGVM